MEYYLGAKKAEKYFLDWLEELSEENKARCMTLRRLTSYYSSFLPIALWLEDKEVISRSEADEYFWFGLPKRIWKLVKQELGLDAMIPLMKQALKKAHHILEEMLEEEEEEGSDLFGWPSITEPSSTTGFLVNEELSHDDVPEARNKEPQEFKGEEEVVAWVNELEMMAGVAENKDIEEELAVTKEDPAVTKEELASNKDILEVNKHIPAESSNFPDPKDISISCKIILPNKHIIFTASEVLSMLEDLSDSQVSYTLPFLDFYGPVHQIFSYTKVRKKNCYKKMTKHQHTNFFLSFFRALAVHLAVQLVGSILSCFALFLVARRKPRDDDEFFLVEWIYTANCKLLWPSPPDFCLYEGQKED